MNKSDWQEELVFTSQSKRRGYGSKSESSHSKDVRFRVRVIWAMFVGAFAIIFSKILYLQVVERGQHELTSYENHVGIEREIAPRGIIYDRDGKPLVENQMIDGKMKRIYPQGAAIAPVLGYISEVTSDEVGCTDGLCYKPGSLIGRSGVEQMLESQLKGRDGEEF